MRLRRRWRKTTASSYRTLRLMPAAPSCWKKPWPCATRRSPSCRPRWTPFGKRRRTWPGRWSWSR
ncbi:unnamed protein product [Durusdinium trenchii]|uniref:Uncharacterized protein n=2 Tax=Durusdinium trenchii TaxID=1381693 RepID=A0ABP0JYW0_9DINO